MQNKEKEALLKPFRPWYNNWWVWLIIILIVLFFRYKSPSGVKNKAYHPQTYNGVTANYIHRKAKLTYDDETYSISSRKIYHLDYKNNDWKKASFRVNKVIIYKTRRGFNLDDSEDHINGEKTYHGFARVYMYVMAHKKIEVDPCSADFAFSNLEQHEVDNLDEDWDGTIKKDATKSGHVTVPINKLKNPEEIKWLSLKFDVSDKNDNDSRMIFKLNLEK